MAFLHLPKHSAQKSLQFPGSNTHRPHLPNAPSHPGPINPKTECGLPDPEERLRSPAAAAEGSSTTSTATLPGAGELHVLPLTGQSRARPPLVCVTGEGPLGPGEERHSRARGACPTWRTVCWRWSHGYTWRTFSPYVVALMKPDQSPLLCFSFI